MLRHPGRSEQPRRQPASPKKARRSPTTGPGPPARRSARPGRTVQCTMFALSRSAKTWIVWKSSLKTATPVRPVLTPARPPRARLLVVVARPCRRRCSSSQYSVTCARTCSGVTRRGAVAEGLEQLAVGEQADRRVGEAGGDGLRARARSSCCSRRRTGTTACARGRRSPAGSRRSNSAGSPDGNENSCSTCAPRKPSGSRSASSRATIAPPSEPCMPYDVVAEPRASARRRRGRRGPSSSRASTTGVQKPKPGHRRDHDVEGVLGAAAVGDGVGERADHVEEVEERAGVGVREQQRRRAPRRPSARGRSGSSGRRSRSGSAGRR